MTGGSYVPRYTIPTQIACSLSRLVTTSKGTQSRSRPMPSNWPMDKSLIDWPCERMDRDRTDLP